MRSRTLGVTAALLAFALVAAACGGDPGSTTTENTAGTSGAPAPGGTLRIALVSDMSSAFDPQKEYYGVAWEYYRCCLLRTLMS